MSRHALLVTGSRSLAESEAARAWATEQLRGVVGSLPDGTVVLTGGADGPDAWATWMAEQRGLAWVEWHADGSRCSSLGGPSSWLPPPRGVGTPVVWTARVGYRGSDGLDVTRKSASADGLPFAPSWAILSPELDARRRGEDAAAALVLSRLAGDGWRVVEQRGSWWVLGRDEPAAARPQAK